MTSMNLSTLIYRRLMDIRRHGCEPLHILLSVAALERVVNEIFKASVEVPLSHLGRRYDVTHHPQRSEYSENQHYQQYPFLCSSTPTR